MAVILKCGSCGHMYSVDSERAKEGTTGRRCPNCGALIPGETMDLLTTVLNMSTYDLHRNWEFYNIPETFSKAEVIVTFPLK